MRCNICGTEFFGGNGFCPGCGYNYGAGGVNRPQGAPSVYQMPVNGPEAGPQGYNGAPPYTPFYPQQPAMRQPEQKVKTFLMIAGVLILLGVIAFFVYTFKTADSNYDFGSFSIDLPASMTKDTNSTFSSYYISHGGDAGEYANNSVRFVYASFDSSSQIGTYSSSDTVNALSESYKELEGYEMYDKSGNSLKFKMMVDDIQAYCHFRTTSENGKIYYLFLVCSDSQRSRYEDKFDKYMASFKTK